jgi:adenosylhomocysteinase
MSAAAALGEVFITATGCRDVITVEHLDAMRDGAILANAGHFDVEINVAAVADLAVAANLGIRPQADEYLMADGRRLIVLAEGRVVNLVAAEGSPAAAMDVSFAVQVLALTWLASGEAPPAAGVHAVPAAIDAQVAALALDAAGTRIDALTAAQQRYLDSWREGS